MVIICHCFCALLELDLWQHKRKVDSKLGSTLNTLEKALDHADCDFFPNIHTFLCIMGTLPVTSCECERSISMLTEEHNGTGTSWWFGNAVLPSWCSDHTRGGGGWIYPSPFKANATDLTSHDLLNYNHYDVICHVINVYIYRKLAPGTPPLKILDPPLYNSGSNTKWQTPQLSTGCTSNRTDAEHYKNQSKKTPSAFFR